MKKLILLVSLAFVLACGGGGGSSGEGSTAPAVIEISYKDIDEIGLNPDYPLDANYKLIDSGAILGELAPIGNNSFPFTGTFDGNGQTVTITQMNNVLLHNGLFGYIQDATVKNLTVDIGTKISINYGSNSQEVSVGALAGIIEQGSIVANVHVVGAELKVISTGAAVYSVGGLAGDIYSSSIIESSVEIDLAASSDSITVAGIVGYAANAEIENSFFRGDVTANGADAASFPIVFAGGLVGMAQQDVDILTSHSAGNIKATNTANTKIDIAGGLIGYSEGHYIDNSAYIEGTVFSSSTGFANYATGYNETQGAYTLVGQNNRGATASLSGGGDTSKGTALTQVNMQESTFIAAGWDFTNIWIWNGFYPELRYCAFVSNS